MRLLLRGPVAGDGEAFFEVCAEVVHAADGEKDIDAELEDFQVPALEPAEDGAEHC